MHLLYMLKKKSSAKRIVTESQFDHTISDDYHNLINKIRPLDIIAFRGSEIISDIVEFAQKYFLGSGEFTHVALVVNNELLPDQNLEPGKLYIWESTISGIPFVQSDNVAPVDTGKCYMGVQLRSLEDVLYKYLSGNSKTYAAWCPLHDNPCVKRIDENDEMYQGRFTVIKAKFNELFNLYHYRSYELDIANMLGSIYKPARWYRKLYNGLSKKVFKGLRYLHLVDPKTHDPSCWQFCSELIARVYKEFDIISDEYDPSDVVPMDFFGYDQDGIPNVCDDPVYINRISLSDLIQASGEKEPRYHHKRAFLVGINYRGSQYELNGCINDVENIKDVLVKIYHYDLANILVLTDDTPYKPTKANIVAGWKWLYSNLPSSDFVGEVDYPYFDNAQTAYYFHYSGHGSYVEDVNGDEKDGRDEVLCPIDHESNGMIVDDDIRILLADKVNEKSRLVCTMDCCHSGTSIDLQFNATVNQRNNVELEVNNAYAPTKGNVIMISGCKDHQTSADIALPSGAVGALSFSLLAVLHENNYQISYGDLIVKIRNYIKTNRLSDQIPCLSFGKWTNIQNIYSF